MSLFNKSPSIPLKSAKEAFTKSANKTKHEFMKLLDMDYSDQEGSGDDDSGSNGQRISSQRRSDTSEMNKSSPIKG